jgi:hypothetical protein
MPTTFFNNISVSPSAYHLNSRYGNFTFDYIDYNNYYARLVWRNVNTTYTSLSAWRTFIQTLLSGAESHSIVTNPNFINASGTYLLATDFKRSSYPTDGRGGSYPSVMGAYVTGDEQIGSDLPKYFYVSTTGSDTTGDGSYFNPWATPEKAFSMATAGYIVYFREGEYTLTSTTDFGYVGHNGTAESPIIFSGYPGETASINCNALMATGEVGPIYVRNKTYNFFEDLTFSNYKTCINFETADGGGIINCNGSTTLKDSLGNNDGFAHIHTSTNILIQNNTVVGPGLTGLSGTFACMVLFGNCNGLKILNNKCGNAPNGIYYKHGWPEPISPITMEIAGNFITSSTQNPLGGNMNYCKIHDNIIGPGCGMGGMTFCNDNGWIGGNYNEIYHNTICANTAVGYDAISMGINYEGHEEPPQMKGEWGQYNTVRDNLFTKKVYYYAYAPTDVSFNITADYNLFPASSVVVGYEGSQMSLEDWNIISEQDLNSVTGTPIFVGSDFSQIPSYELTEESPGKNAASDGKDMGADVSLVGCK